MMERKGKKLLKLLTAAVGLILLVAFAAPSAFAFGGAMPPAIASPSNGLPKTRSGKAPVGALKAQEMSSKVKGPSLNHKMEKVKGAREARTTVAREISTARSEGFNVSHARKDELLGNEALKYGNQDKAMAYYNRAENQLRVIGYPAPGLIASR